MNSARKVDLAYPEFNILYRGPLRLGVLLYIKGIKIYYFDFVKNKRLAIFEKYLFKNDDARLGKFRIENLEQLSNLLSNQSISSSVFGSCQSICSSSTTSFNSLRSIYSDIEKNSHNNLVQYATEKIRLELIDTSNQLISEVTDSIQSMQQQSALLISNLNKEVTSKVDELKTLLSTTVPDTSEDAYAKSLKTNTSDANSTNSSTRVLSHHSEDHSTAKSIRTTIGSESISDGDATLEQNQDDTNSTQKRDAKIPYKVKSDRDRINQYFKEGKAFSGKPLRTRGKDRIRVPPVKVVILQPFKTKTAMLTMDDRNKFLRYYKRYPVAEVLDAEIRYILHKPESRPLLEKIGVYTDGSPCLADIMPKEQFLKELFNMLLESQLIRPY